MVDTLDACVDAHDWIPCNHYWVEDDAFVRVDFEDQYCCECGIFRKDVKV